MLDPKKAPGHPSATVMDPPRKHRGFWLWSDSVAGVEVRFLGRGPTVGVEALPRVLGEAEVTSVAWARQVHSTIVLEAGDGLCGPGDALRTSRAGVALAVVTADCVPVVLAGEGSVAAVHAGWRGIAGGILGAAVNSLDVPPEALSAWIGPSIGPCCYEVGEEVAGEVLSSLSEGPDVCQVASEGPRGRPHLNLVQAVLWQLSCAGVRVSEISRVEACTRCDEVLLQSYRRDGKGAGRNVTLVWRRPS